MPGLPCVYLMLPGPLGQAILEADEKEAINSSSDLAKIGELVAAEEAKNPEIRSVPVSYTHLTLPTTPYV